MTSALAIQRSRAGAVACAIVARLPDGAVKAIFAGGSLGRGEVWFARAGEGLEIYSDVDLYVVVDDAARRDAVLAAARAAEASFDLPAGVELLRGVDVGVYPRTDLLAQPVRPGTADLGTAHLFLHGDRAIMTELAAAMARPMSPLESLYLIENRARELAGAAPTGGAAARMHAVAQLKARMDAGTAHLIAAGMFAPTVTAREARLRDAPPASLAGRDRERILGAFDAARDLEGYLARAEAGTGSGETMDLLAASWRAIASQLLRLPPEPPGSLVERRCGAGARLGNARELVRMRRVAGWGMARALAQGARFSALSPRCALRLQPLCAELARHDPGDSLRRHRDYVDRLTRVLGVAGATLTERAHGAHARVTGEAR